MSDAADGGAVGCRDAAVLAPQACSLLVEKLPRASSLDAAMAVVESARQSALGDGLLTINQVLVPEPGQAEGCVDLQRIWSSNPQAYPVAGRKRKTLTPWSRQLLLQAQLYVGQGEADLAQVFDDHALIRSLGLRAVINVPLLDASGRCFATFNVLTPQAVWRDQDVLLVRLLALLATPAVARAAAMVERTGR